MSRLIRTRCGASAAVRITFACLMILCASHIVFGEDLPLHPDFYTAATHSLQDGRDRASVTQLITGQGYPVETHTAVTADGYILGLYRIPRGRGEPAESGAETRPAVLVQHALLDCCASFVNNLANESLGFILADAGFDVWLGNSRGNTYSRAHTHLSPESDAFWAFTWDEMAQYDVPAMVDYVLNTTGAATLAYVGHSQGSLIAFAALAANAQLAARLSVMVALAPPVFVAHALSPLFIAMSELRAWEVVRILGARDVLASTNGTERLFPEICRAVPHLCVNFMFAVCGFDRPGINATRLPSYLAYTPSGTSTRNMIHWSQMLRSGRFAKYDFGTQCDGGQPCNQRAYNSTVPPAYNLSRIAVPTALYSGGRDWLADPPDVVRLAAALPPDALVADVQLADYEHLDFSWGIDAAVSLYPDVVALLRRHST